MKKISVKSALPAAIIALTGFSQLAGAHCFNNATLPAATNVADVYRIRCATGDGSPEAPSLLPTQRLQAQLNLQSGGDGTANNQVRLQIGGTPTTPSAVGTDSSNGAAINTAGSPPACTAPNFGGAVTLANGNSDYSILVNKTGTTAKTYGINFHCQDGSAAHEHTVTMEIHAGTVGELAGNTNNSPDSDLIVDQ